MERKLIRTLSNGAKMWSYGTMKGGDKDVDKTVRLMKYYGIQDSTSPEVQKIANEIRSQHSSDYAQIKAAYMYVVENMRYIEDGEDEFVASPRHALTWLKQGDCDCMTTSVVSILLALGFKDLYSKVIAWKEDSAQNEFTHVYAMALIPSLNVVIPLDPVMEIAGFGGEKQPVKRIKIYRIA